MTAAAPLPKPARRGRGARLAALATSLACALAPTAARAQADEEGDGGLSAYDRARAEATAKAPSGPYLELAAPRAPRAVRACGMRRPICVHADATASGPTVLAALDALERAWDVLTGALRLPAPDVDPTRGRYDVVLESEVPGGWETRPIARDSRSAHDRAGAESSLDVRSRPGCALDTQAFRALARASLLRAAPGATEGVARAQVAYLGSLAVPCSVALAAAEAQAFQSQPDRGVTEVRAAAIAPAVDDPGPRAFDPGSRLYADGAALFWSRLDWAFGKNPGDVVRATWTLAATRTKPDALRWWNEPDALDVLRVSFKGTLATGSTLADALLDVAVARAFMGEADDGAHQPETRALGDSARVRLDWDISWPDKPRRLAPRAPVTPTGSSYVVVRTEGAKPDARLRVEIEWEEHALFRWAVVKLDRSGHEVGRVMLPTTDRALEAQVSVVDLAGVDRLLVVGAGVGDPSYPFDPDDEVWEPHGWLLSVAAE